MSTPIEIAIIEDLVPVALNLQELFNEEDDIRCDHVFHNAEDALEVLTEISVDVILLDIGLPGMDGISFMKEYKVPTLATEVCVFTVFEQEEKLFNSLKEGAKGYILKSEDPEVIVEALRELYAGGSPMSPSIARKVLDSFSRNTTNKNLVLQTLTRREQELLVLLANGLLYKEIAINLDIKMGTVKQHIHHIYDKLHVNNRTEAVNKYLGR